MEKIPFYDERGVRIWSKDREPTPYEQVKDWAEVQRKDQQKLKISHPDRPTRPICYTLMDYFEWMSTNEGEPNLNDLFEYLPRVMEEFPLEFEWGDKDLIGRFCSGWVPTKRERKDIGKKWQFEVGIWDGMDTDGQPYVYYWDEEKKKQEKNGNEKIFIPANKGEAIIDFYVKMINKFDGNIMLAAKEIGVTRQTLHNHLRKHKIKIIKQLEVAK